MQSENTVKEDDITHWLCPTTGKLYGSEDLTHGYEWEKYGHMFMDYHLPGLYAEGDWLNEEYMILLHVYDILPNANKHGEL